MSTFEAWPKVPRWNREVVITEKIDGTNAAIIIEPWSPLVNEVSDGWNSTEDYYRRYGRNGDTLLAVVGDPREREFNGSTWVEHGPDAFGVWAQSRTRLIHAGADNFGFAAWVQKNAEELVKLLGPGRHFGEWYGQGIQRNYGLDHKRFALFRWNKFAPDFDHPQHPGRIHPTLPVDVVPVLGKLDFPGQTVFCDLVLDELTEDLRDEGSALVPGFKKPEGVVLYHTAANQTFKILLEGDELPKSVATKQEKELAA